MMSSPEQETRHDKRKRNTAAAHGRDQGKGGLGKQEASDKKKQDRIRKGAPHDGGGGDAGRCAKGAPQKRRGPKRDRFDDPEEDDKRHHRQQAMSLRGQIKRQKQDKAGENNACDYAA